MNQSKFLADMNVKSWADDCVVEIFPAKEECFDAGWILPQSGAPTEPFAILVDCKSGDVSIPKASRGSDRVRVQ